MLWRALLVCDSVQRPLLSLISRTDILFFGELSRIIITANNNCQVSDPHLYFQSEVNMSLDRKSEEKNPQNLTQNITGSQGMNSS